MGEECLQNSKRMYGIGLAVLRLAAYSCIKTVFRPNQKDGFYVIEFLYNGWFLCNLAWNGNVNEWLRLILFFKCLLIFRAQKEM